MRSIVPRGDGTPDDDYPTRVQRAVFGYVRGQLLFSLIMGTSAGAMLWIAGTLGIFPDGKTYALVFGAWFGFAELIPYIGPAIGALPPIIVALFSDNPVDAVWLGIMFTVLQQLEGHVVAPTVFSQALRINPLLVIFALLIGGRLYGFAGAFLALPLAAVVRETFMYFREHLVLEPWGTPSAAALRALPAGGADRRPARRVWNRDDHRIAPAPAVPALVQQASGDAAGTGGEGRAGPAGRAGGAGGAHGPDRPVAAPARRTRSAPPASRRARVSRRRPFGRARSAAWSPTRTPPTARRAGPSSRARTRPRPRRPRRRRS